MSHKSGLIFKGNHEDVEPRNPLSFSAAHLFPAVNLYLANRTDADCTLQAVSAAFSEAVLKGYPFLIFYAYYFVFTALLC